MECCDPKNAMYVTLSIQKFLLDLIKIEKCAKKYFDHRASPTDDTIYLDDDQADQKCVGNVKDVS